MTKVSFPEASTGLLIYVLIKVNDFCGKPTVVNRIFSVNSATDRGISKTSQIFQASSRHQTKNPLYKFGKLDCHKNKKMVTVPLDVVPERRTKRCPPNFRSAGRFWEPGLDTHRPGARWTGRERNVAPLDHFHLFSSALLRPIYIYTPISKNVVGENGEWQLSNGNCTTERNCGFHICKKKK